MRAATLRPEVFCEEMPAPQRIAPHSFALSADVTVDGTDVGTGRIILLHDPDGNDAWDGTFRCVAYARAEIEIDMITDPMLPGVGWTWLVEALDAHGADYTAASGTVTRVATDSFGGMSDEGGTAQIEIRASWTPLTTRRRSATTWRPGASCSARPPGLPPVPGRRHRHAQPAGSAGAGTLRPMNGQDDTPEEAVPPGPPAPLLRLREPLPDVVDTDDGLRATAAALGAGTGPLAIDAERASGYRYSSRAYLIQLRREGAGTHLVDPIGLSTLAPLQEVVAGTEWIIHAATQDLPCLAELGLVPATLFDTELAGRLLGYPRVGLATLVETLLGRRLAKEHSAVDWSTRPLPRAVAGVRRPRRRGAGRAARRARRGAGRDGQGRLGAAGVRRGPRLRAGPPRRRRGGVRRGCTGSGAGARWARSGRCGRLRDEIARERDVTPGRILPDSAIVAAATAMPGRPTDAAAHAGLPRPRRRPLRRAVDRGAPRGRRAARGGAADARHPAATARRCRAPGRRRTRSPPAG